MAGEREKIVYVICGEVADEFGCTGVCLKFADGQKQSASKLWGVRVWAVLVFAQIIAGRAQQQLVTRYSAMRFGRLTASLLAATAIAMAPMPSATLEMRFLSDSPFVKAGCT